MLGYTNYYSQFLWAQEYETSLKADGWLPMKDRDPGWYTRDGFVACVSAREMPSVAKYKYHAEVSIWAPDKLQIVVPEVYSMDDILKATSTCAFCRKTDVPTQRVGFAGRCCEDCLPAQRKVYEYRGWAN